MAQQQRESSPPKPTGRKKHERRSKREWKRIVREWSESGKTQSAFCEEASISLSSFRWWRKQLRREEREREMQRKAKKNGDSACAPFVRVDMPSVAVSAARFEVLLANGRAVRVASGFAEEELGRLLRLVESLPC